MKLISDSFSEVESLAFYLLEAKKLPIQARLDELRLVIQSDASTNKMVKDARAEIFEVKKGLVPLAQMQAGLASADSRDKYFPELSKRAFVEYVNEQLK